MKQKRTTHYCLNKECEWTETSHKMCDGMKCPKCKGHFMSKPLIDAIVVGSTPPITMTIQSYGCLHEVDREEWMKEFNKSTGIVIRKNNRMSGKIQ
ncbi:hypothetical protein IEQ_05028 [Bacillus cereus BAG6X1-2]|nr:hypothetical protein IEQ_05028 [Bacillus cereus BAG6X1-2]